ncbi:MAG: hypothetical protein CEN89_123 [Candidatus Berkelbacteria bacterium Licking1014_7]|uniref:DUF881 domain-containing protein n=1 Tax=Candidatus Berkelbacteria bacterium Licking1014_7 TaxID=2017147 RepID=A0A554LKF3_9BACT|nr:MAG: hypothetical protein CEN89_123 [Candidatus Berkelbacteria bacterium Licking1014_7]
MFPFTRLHRLKVQLSISLLIIGIGIGWLFATQFQTKPSRALNPVAPYLSLTQSQATLTRDQEDTKKKIKKLREEITDRQDELKSQQKTDKQLLEQIGLLKEQVGLTEIKGAGLVITLADSSKEAANIDSIVHAADMRDVVNVLWLSGAQTITINEQRLVYSTSIDSIINTILVNNTKITNPFVIRAIGETKKMKLALKTHSALSDIRRRVSEQGLVFHFEESRDITVAEFASSINLIYANTE